MTTFIDGPAQGKTLMLKRQPRFLRVVKGEDFDALDQLTDKPLPEESVWAYQLKEVKGRVHINSRKAGGWYVIADYELCPVQPSDLQLRNNHMWQGWCLDQARALPALEKP